MVSLTNSALLAEWVPNHTNLSLEWFIECVHVGIIVFNTGQKAVGHNSVLGHRSRSEPQIYLPCPEKTVKALSEGVIPASLL